MATFTDEQRAFLLDTPHVGKVATVRADGRPHIAPIWYTLDGDTIIFNTGATTVKGRNIQRTGQLAFSVDDEKPPYAFLLVDGTATIDEDPDELLKWATVIGGRYMGQDKAEELGKRNGVPGELIVRVTPTKIVFQKDVSA